jgi:molybdate/tungstate transport system substrate-binding protein
MNTRTRRSFLTTLAGAGLIGTAGCLGEDDHVSVLSAGSLAVVLDDHLGRQFEEDAGTGYRGEYHGSNAVMRMIVDRQKHPDVAVSADSVLLRDRLYGKHADWDVEFASNAVGLAYAPDTPVGERLEAGEPWYEVVPEAKEGAFAISDPDLDPLGYRAIHAFRLAEREHGLDGFAERLTENAYREPEEPRLLAGVEAGNRSAAVVYANMAADHDLPFRAFPDAYNFSNPAFADHYATVSYTTDEGYTATGRPVVYNATVLRDADNPEAGREFVRFLVDSQSILSENGLIVGGFPDTHGDPPGEVVPA